MLLRELVDASKDVAAVRGRRDKTSKLADLLRKLDRDEIVIGVTFLSGALIQGRVGLGWSAIVQARSIPPADEPSLELKEVNDAFERISRTSGAGSSKERARVLEQMFRQATSSEQDFLIRLIAGELRQGAVEGVIADAIAKAASVSGDSVRHAAMICGNLAEVARVALGEGPSSLSKYAIQIFRPVEPMLASTAESVGEALEWMGEAAFELKLDGARIQVHRSGETVRVFSRALRDVTAAVPEVVQIVRTMPAREVILDGEVLALDASGSPLPFQETMRRFGRRLDVDRLKAELPLTPFFFDCLQRDGNPLMEEPQRSRFHHLAEIVGNFAVPHQIIAGEQDAQAFFNQAVAIGHEGVMAKALDARYAAGSRGRAWLKIKHVRTLDLVVLAAEWGNGRRRGWLSNLHLGAREPGGSGFVMLGKTFKGMTDEMLEWQTKALLEREVARDGHIVFVRPELVVEIAFNDIQASPQYPGGLALRFARVKGYRPDKHAEDADTIEALQSLYRATTGRAAPPRSAPRA